MAVFIDMDSAKTAGVGHIVRIIGAVVDVKFKGGVPNIYNALTVDVDTPVGHIDTILEVESQLPGDVVRCVAMTSTDGLQRGLEVVDTGAPMKMPVGKGTLGRIWNVMGRHQGRRPARALHPWRQDGSVRRRRRWQDRSDSGAHQQPRPGARRHFGVHRCRRAHP